MEPYEKVKLEARAIGMYLMKGALTSRRLRKDAKVLIVLAKELEKSGI